MNNSKMSCPKCKSAMEEGFIADSKDHSAAKVSEWIEGEPERSFWFGIKTGGRVNLRVKSFRCVRCGFLESYAPLSQDQ